MIKSSNKKKISKKRNPGIGIFINNDASAKDILMHINALVEGKTFFSEPNNLDIMSDDDKIEYIKHLTDSYLY